MMQMEREAQEIIDKILSSAREQFGPYYKGRVSHIYVSFEINDALFPFYERPEGSFHGQIDGINAIPSMITDNFIIVGWKN